MNDIQVYNLPAEVGVRILLILCACNKKMSIQRIVYYDYFSLHLNDLKPGKPSLHPDNPNHSSEIAIKRKLISGGLQLMISKGLITVKYTKTGIYYCANELTYSFVKLFQNNYAEKLRENIAEVESFFSDYTDRKIQKYVDRHIGKWTGEVEYIHLGGI